MKNLILLVTLILGAQLASAQRSKEPSIAKEDAVSLKNYQLKVNPAIQLDKPSNTTSSKVKFQNRAFQPQFEKDYLEVYKDEKTQLPIFIKKPVQAQRSNIALPVQSFQFLESVKQEMQIETPSEEFVLLAERTHNRDNITLKYGQVYKELPVLDAEVIFQVKNGQVHSMSGRYFATPELENVTPAIQRDDAFEIALTDVAQYTIVEREGVNKHMDFICSPDQKELVIFHKGKEAILAWHLDFHPSIRERWTYVIDAQTNEILIQRKNSCSLHNHDFSNATTSSCSHADHDHAPAESEPSKSSNMAGPFSGSGADLLGITRPIQGYESNGSFVLADPSRTMFNAGQSNMPNSPVGAIWTLNAMNTSPQSNNFDYDHCRNNSSSWNDRVQVSGHYNSGEAYEYFINTHQRNSINANGGNIVGFVNVSEENGDSMENAYWNGNAIFYGNGGNVFRPLARALDVAGHEMSHGVVQTTANLVYENQSGALNESFADIFGAMIDRNDWKIGEDVVNTQFFPSGALRDLQDPNQGGSSLSDNGWQPKHMNEFQNLPNTPQGDNGGVHINSGITNHAYYLIAISIGKSGAEQIFYKALTEYLVRSSQFIDLRVAAERSAIDLFGAGSAELAAVQQGFNEVGIGSGTTEPGSGGTTTQTEIGTNAGTDFILFSDPQLNNLFITQTADLDNRTLISETNQLSKPSITDDGSVIVFIGADNRAYIIELDFENNSLEESVLIDDPIWRNIVISKDASRIALITDQAVPEILIFDFATQSQRVYDLFNPTFTQGINTDNVQFADVMEFDFSGEFLMYDALSELTGSDFGEFIEYWDIGIMQVWNNQANGFVGGENNINKLFSQIPENTSIGNPSFAKNADFIVTFDFIDEQGDASVFATNVETGEVSDEAIFTNSILNYPNYSIDDGAVIFDAQSNGNQVIGTVDVNADRLNATSGDAFLVLEEARWGTWFGTAQRDLTDTYELTDAFELAAYPNPASDQVTIQFANPTANDILLEIYNIQGQLVKSTQIDGGAQSVNHNQNIDGMHNGVYLVKILIDNQYATTKLTIQK